MMRQAVLAAISIGVAFGQVVPPGPAAGILVSGAKARITHGEPLKLTAVSRDASGQPRTGDTFTWSSTNTEVVAVDAQGNVTTTGLGYAEVRAAIGNLRGSIWLQVTPLRIVVSPGSKLMYAGERQQFRAAALDVKGQEIAGAALQWDIVNARLGTTVIASVDRNGNMAAGGAGRFFVRARFVYQGQFNVPFVPYVEGTADITVRLRPSYTIRELSATGVRGEAATLGARRTLVAANQQGEIAFQGSLDGSATGLLVHSAGETSSVAVSGSPGPNPPGFIYEFQNFALNDSGEVLSRAVVAGSPSGLLLASRSGQRWYGVEGMYLGGIENLNGFYVTRNSLNNASDALVRAAFRLAGETATPTGLFRFTKDGAVDLITSTADELPDMPPNFTYDNDFGMANDGTIFFRVTSGTHTAIYRQQGYDRPERIIGAGDSLGSNRVVSLPGSTFLTFYVSGRGDLVTLVSLSNNTTVLAHFEPGSKEARVLTFRSLAGVFAVKEGNILWYGDAGRGVGIQLSKPDEQAAPVLLHNQEIGGEPVISFDAAAFGLGEEVIVMARTRSKPLVLARVNGADVTPVLESGAAVRGASALSFTSFVGGVEDSHAPLLNGGGEPANLLEYADGALRPAVKYGERMTGDVVSYGLFATTARRNPRGDLFLFISPYGLNVPNYGVYEWNSGQPQSVLRLNFNWPDGTQQFTGSVHSVSDSGWFLLSGATSRSHARMYTLKDGVTRTIATNSGHPDYVTELGKAGAVIAWNDAVITESGRVMALFRFRNTPNALYVWENDSWTEAASINSTRLVGLTVTSINAFKAAGDNFYASFSLSGGGTALGRWNNGGWEILTSHEGTLPTGQPVAGIGAFDVNRRGDAVFLANSFAWPVMVRRDAKGDLSLVSYTFDLESVSTQIVRYVDVDLRDDGRVYFIGLDHADRYVLFEAVPN